MLKEMKEKDVQLRDGTIGLLTLTMNTAAMKGDASTIRRLQETIFTLGLAKPSSNLCSPLISCYLERWVGKTLETCQTLCCSCLFVAPTALHTPLKDPSIRTECLTFNFNNVAVKIFFFLPCLAFIWIGHFINRQWSGKERGGRDQERSTSLASNSGRYMSVHCHEAIGTNNNVAA